MTEDQTLSPGPDEVERRDYAALVDSLTDALDLRGGLAEALDVAGYTAMSSHIAGLLNLEAGLRSALATHHDTRQPREPGAATTVTELLRRAGDGDSAAWDELARRYSDVVITAVRSFRLQAADAEDAVQMAWLRLAENCHRIQRPEHLSGWLATTARRECLHILRHQRQHPPPTPQDATEAAARRADSSASPEQLAIDAGIEARALLRMLFGDKLDAEADRAAGIPPGTIRPTRARARWQLRRRLEERRRLNEQGLTAAATPRETGEGDLPAALDVLDPEVAVLPLPDVAQRLGLAVTRIHQMLRDGQLLGIRRHGRVVVPTDFLSGNTVVKGLPDTITMLREAGYSAEEILRWLFTAEDSLSGTPIGALRSHSGVPGSQARQ